MPDDEAVHVTFDRNVCNRIRSGIGPRRKAPKEEYHKLLEAIRAGMLRPYLSEATLTFELFSSEDRLLVLLRYFARPAIRPAMPEPPPGTQQWLEDLFEIGFRVLRAPPRVGLTSFIRLDQGWADDTRFSREERQDRQGRLVERFEHLGEQRLREWGQELARIHKLERVPPHEQPYSHYPNLLWFNGLMAEADDPKQCSSREDFLGKLRKVFSNWFDLDSVASHYGYGLDYFCTDDTGRGSVDETVFHPENREVLAGDFGVRVVGAQQIVEVICP